MQTPQVRITSVAPAQARRPEQAPDRRFAALLDSLARLQNAASGRGDSIGELRRALGEAGRAQQAVDELARMFEDAFRRALGS